MTDRIDKQVLLEGTVEMCQALREELAGASLHGHLVAYLVAIRVAGGKTVDYETLATVSGVGPTFCYQRRRFTGCYVFLPGEDERIAKATGFRFERKWCESPDDRWTFIKEAAGSGSVVQAEAWGRRLAFAGYQDAPAPEDRKVFAILSHMPREGKWCTWDEFVGASKGSDPSMARIAEKAAKEEPATLASEVLGNLVA